MQTPDALTRDFTEAARYEAEVARGRQRNVEIFTSMYLTLGPDVLKLDGTRHDAELLEARGLAAARWNQLHGMESQIQREEAALATRPKKRPTQPGDDALPDRTIEKQARAWEDQTKYLHAALADLRKSAAAERKELESYTAKRR